MKACFDLSLDYFPPLLSQLSREEVEEPGLLPGHQTLSADTIPAAVSLAENYLNNRSPMSSVASANSELPTASN